MRVYECAMFPAKVVEKLRTRKALHVRSVIMSSGRKLMQWSKLKRVRETRPFIKQDEFVL